MRVQCDGPFEHDGQQHVSQRLRQTAQAPLLVAGHPQDTESEVVVHADDVTSTTSCATRPTDAVGGASSEPSAPEGPTRLLRRSSAGRLPRLLPRLRNPTSTPPRPLPCVWRRDVYPRGVFR